MITVDRRYRFLRLVIWLLRIAALIIFVLAVVAGVLVLMGMTGIDITGVSPSVLTAVRALGTLPALPTLALGILIPLSLLTVAELMRVALDIEENTRSTAVSQQTVAAELHTFITNLPDVSTIPQNTRFVADDMQRVAQILEGMADEQRAVAGTLRSIEQRLPPAA